jgi:hypothetical protein
VTPTSQGYFGVMEVRLSASIPWSPSSVLFGVYTLFVSTPTDDQEKDILYICFSREEKSQLFINKNLANNFFKKYLSKSNIEIAFCVLYDMRYL